MKQPTDVLAQNLQALREERNLSLAELAELSGVSKSMLWQVESAQSSPTIATIWKIANGLRVPFTAFFRRQESEVVLGALKANPPLETASQGYRLYPIIPFDPERSFEVYYVEMDPGTTLDAEPHRGSAQETVLVRRGTVEITVDEACHTVDDAHFITFLANCPHSYHNPGNETATAVMMISYLA